MSLWKVLADLVFDDVGLIGFKSWANAFYWLKLLARFLSSIFFLSLISFYWLVLWAIGSLD